MFGRDLENGEVVGTRIRRVVGQDLSEPQVLACWDSCAGTGRSHEEALT
jgi:hypothetical protein